MHDTFQNSKFQRDLDNISVVVYEILNLNTVLVSSLFSFFYAGHKKIVSKYRSTYTMFVKRSENIIITCPEPLHFPARGSTPVVPWLSYSPLEPRFAGSDPAGFNEFFRA